MDPSKKAEREAEESWRVKVTKRRGGKRSEKGYEVRGKEMEKKLDKAEVPSFEFVTATRWRGKFFCLASSFRCL